MVSSMKTTVDIPEPLLEQARKVAAQRSTTLRELVAAGLRHVIREQRRGGKFELRDARVEGNGLREEFRAAGWDRIRDAAYEGRGS
jgi:hypothetical protein